MFENDSILTILSSRCGLHELKTILLLDDVLPDLRVATHVPASKWHYNVTSELNIFISASCNVTEDVGTAYLHKKTKKVLYGCELFRYYEIL